MKLAFRGRQLMEIRSREEVCLRLAEFSRPLVSMVMNEEGGSVTIGPGGMNYHSSDGSGRAFRRRLTRLVFGALGLPTFEIKWSRRRREQSVFPVARRLTVLAAWVLPKAVRATKAEEFASELYDLAQSGRRRRAQLAYACRVLVLIASLRRDLIAAQRATERG